MTQPLVHPLLVARRVTHGFGLRDSPPQPAAIRPEQVHGCEVARVRGGVSEPAAADAIVAAEPGLMIGIVTADCVPILACAEDGGAVAAIHAGWRGLASGVVAAGIAALRKASGEAGITAVVGPHVGPCCYEVDGPVVDALRSSMEGDLDEALAPARAGHWNLDLGRVAALQLDRAGVPPEVCGRFSNVCTACDAARFHSHRRDGDRSGRLLHTIEARRAAAGVAPGPQG